MTSDEIIKCKQERTTLFEKYYETILLTLAMKYFLSKNGHTCRFLSAEPIFRNKDGDEIEPDIVFQYDHLNQGALCEIKTSLPNEEEYLLKKLKQLEKYCQDVIGWDTPNRQVSNHDVLFFCHELDYDRVMPLLKKWVSEGKLKFAKNVVICEWNITASPKVGVDTVFVRKREGQTSCDELNQMLSNNIKVSVDKLILEEANCKFTRAEPPEEYTMVQLWMNIFPSIHKKFEDFNVTRQNILEKAYEYYIPCSNIGNEFSQIRERWVNKAMKKFCEINLAKELESGEYTVYRSKRMVTRDAKGYFISRVCGETETTGAKPKIQVPPEEAKAQKRISDFLGN